MLSIQKVLIVDDDANIRTIAEMSLEGLTDWQLRLASSAQEALQMINSDKPDVVLLDMMMPDKDGVSFFAEMQKAFAAECPAVIFMTAKVQSHELEKYQKLGAAGVIMKPFDPMTLPDEIMQILDSFVNSK